MAPTLLNNRYRIIRTLGRGGFGETFLVEDTQLPSGRHCVLKQLTPVENNSQIYQLVQERFQREAAILEDLGESSNGQIPRLYAYFAEGDKFYLVQEYIDGDTLTQKLMTQGRMSEASVREVLVGILPILDYIHSKRMVHRDIKPDNIILRRRDQKPVLIDFGAVKETMGTQINSQGNSTRSIIIGTPGFMPSEQATGRPMYASDLYSLGLTAIYLLTGKMPQELGTDPLTGEIQWRQYAPQVSPSLAAVLDKAIRAHGRDRYQTARQMLDALVSGIPTSPPTAVAFGTPLATLDPTIASSPSNGYQNGHQQGQQYGQQHGQQHAQPNPYPPNPYPPNNHSPNVQQNGYANGYPSGNGHASGNGYSSDAAATQPIADAQPPTPQPIPVSQTPSAKSGMSDWLKAVLMGSLIGGFILVGLFVTRPQQQPNDPPTSPESSPITQTPDPDLESRSPSTPIDPDPPSPEPPPPVQVETPAPSPVATPSPEPVPVPSQASISQQDAIDLVDAWLQAKRVMFAPPYSTAPAAQLTTGQLFTDITKPEGTIDWLKTNNAYYQFGVQQIDSVQRFAANGNQATIEVSVTEDRTLYVNGRRDATRSGFETTVTRYTLVSDNGTWRISDYTVMD